MSRELHDGWPAAREVFEEAGDSLGQDMARTCFSATREELNQTANTQPAILTASIAALRVLQREIGIRPVMMAGHSLGEYSALVAAGVLRFRDAVRIVRARGEFMQTAVPLGQGTMAAVLGMKTPELEDVCRQATDPDANRIVEPANYNCPGQVVISGHVPAIEDAASLARKRGASRVLKLPVSAPFHCSLMEPAAQRLADQFASVPVTEPEIPVISNVDAQPNYAPDKTRDLLVRQVSNAVRWEESMALIIREGITRIVEIGPGRVLAGLMKRINRRTSTANIETPADLSALAQALQ